MEPHADAPAPRRPELRQPTSLPPPTPAAQAAACAPPRGSRKGGGLKARGRPAPLCTLPPHLFLSIPETEYSVMAAALLLLA